MNGRKRELVVVGIALSPEFIYAIGPGDIMPDNRRFGIIWMSEKALASAYDLDGAFSSVNLKLLRDASEREVISGSMRCSIATADARRTAARIRRRTHGSTTSSTCSTT